MSNYQKFKQILNTYMTTTIIQRREESSCFSSLFSSCCGGDSSEPGSLDRLSADQRAFSTGINNVADKLNRGEVVSPEDFTGNVNISVQAADSEDAPLLRRKKAPQTSTSGKPYLNFIPESTNKNLKDQVFRLYLNALYHYLHELNTNELSGDISNSDETNNEQKFISDLLSAFERNFDFVAADDLATDEESHNCILFVKNSIKKSIPLQTRAGQINEFKQQVYSLSGKAAASPAGAAITTAAPSAQPEVQTGDFGGSYGVSYQGSAKPAARPAKK